MTSVQTARRRRRSLWPYLAATALFLGYCAWIGGPYLRSIIVRDAAVTAWSNLATAPIGGTVRLEPLAIGESIGADGVLARMRNHHLSQGTVDDAALGVALAEAEVTHAAELLREIERLEDDRRSTKAHYADLFRSQIDTRIERFRAIIALQEERLEVMRAIAERKQQLALSGTGTINAADEVSLRTTEMALAIEELRGDLAYAERRRRAADEGIFIQGDGNDPGWALDSRIDLKLEKKKARNDLRAAEIRLENARAELERATSDLARLSTADVVAPAGRLLWRRHAASGMVLAEGEPVAEWIDCGELLVDMPVSDAEVALVAPGDPAEVVLEGEKAARAAEVLLVRGSASVLGRDELAALAKGRRADLGQVLLALRPGGPGFNGCPVGHAAHVHLPGVGLIDVMRARLRL